MAGRIPENIIQDIKSRLSIREVVSDYVTLTRDGSNYKALCPFHREKTPSFKVNEGMGIFRCFGCGESGNIFTFIMKIEGLSFSEAAHKLAQRAGVVIPTQERSPEQKERETKTAKIFEANQFAEKFYHHTLLNDKGAQAARDYLEQRGIHGELINKYCLGYAPDSWESLLEYLKSKNFSESFLMEAGLAIPRESGGCYDRFRNRIIFPIRDIAGRVCGFGARIMDDTTPKYINSPETAVYKKGQGFFGIDTAKNSIRQADKAVIVEGYFDQIRLAAAGMQYALASLGTAFTPDQARLVRRFTRNVFTVFDPDPAGLKASIRALEVFLEEGITPRILLLPEGQDPDDFVAREGMEKFNGLLEKAPSLVDFFIDRELEEGSSTPAQTAAAVNKIAPVLGKIREPIERSLYVKKIAQRLGIQELEIQRKILRQVRDNDKDATEKIQTQHEENFTKDEEELLALLIHYPEIGQKKEIEKAVDYFSCAELKTFMQKMLGQIKNTGSADPGVILHEEGLENVSGLVTRLMLEKERHKPDLIDAIYKDCVMKVRMEHLRNEQARLQREIQDAQQKQQPDRLNELLVQKNGLLKKERELRAEKVAASR